MPPYDQMMPEQWQAYMQQLSTQPIGGVNYHPEMQSAWRGGPSWIREQTIEPLAFGSLGDPVSQVAFLGAPAMLRGGKGLLDAIATPGPRYGGMLAGERGNLGPPPLGARGEPLPESVLRTPEGALQRYYHGTPNRYADFEMQHMDPDALYGPGVYMTNNPEVAGGAVADAARGYGYLGYASKGYDPRAQARNVESIVLWRDRLQQQVSEQGSEVARLTEQAAGQGSTPALHANNLKNLELTQRKYASLQKQLADVEGHLTQELSQGPHVRPVYADLKRPFDIEAPASPEEVARLLDIGERVTGRRLSQENREQFLTRVTTNKALFNNIGKEYMPQILQEAGYDGIVHTGGAVTGGQPHKVAIAFSEQNVYPSFGIDALLQRPIQ